MEKYILKGVVKKKWVLVWDSLQSRKLEILMLIYEVGKAESKNFKKKAKNNK